MNQIGDESAIAFAKALKTNSTLKQIDLCFNQIGGIAIAKALKTNSKLQQINLDKNQIGDEGAITIAQLQ